MPSHHQKEEKHQLVKTDKNTQLHNGTRKIESAYSLLVHCLSWVRVGTGEIGFYRTVKVLGDLCLIFKVISDIKICCFYTIFDVCLVVQSCVLIA